MLNTVYGNHWVCSPVMESPKINPSADSFFSPEIKTMTTAYIKKWQYS
jgi:hypothetical protein